MSFLKIKVKIVKIFHPEIYLLTSFFFHRLDYCGILCIIILFFYIALQFYKTTEG